MQNRKKKLLGALWETVSGTDGCCTPGSSCCAPATTKSSSCRTSTKTLKVYDPPMCCSTGVCGPNVDPALVRFAADLKWIQGQGVTVERFNLAQSPMAFAENTTVRSELEKKGEAALPLTIVDGEVVASGVYPSRDELATLLSVKD